MGVREHIFVAQHTLHQGHFRSSTFELTSASQRGQRGCCYAEIGNATMGSLLLGCLQKLCSPDMLTTIHSRTTITLVTNASIVLNSFLPNMSSYPIYRNALSDTQGSKYSVQQYKTRKIYYICACKYNRHFSVGL